MTYMIHLIVVYMVGFMIVFNAMKGEPLKGKLIISAFSWVALLIVALGFESIDFNTYCDTSDWCTPNVSVGNDTENNCYYGAFDILCFRIELILWK